MYNHHKRMLPKREDAYRTEYPGNYNNYNYSSSSVYSYSPTSTSDCPEHGRSRKRTTWILVISVVLATLGVLSIAGLAAYLGIISKNISNNASLYEESYLQANTTSTSRGAETSEEDDDIMYNHGRSKEESGFIDLTNSVSDINTGLVPGDDDLINHRVKEPEIVADNFIKYKNTVSRPPEIVHGTKIKPNSNPPIQISAKPVNVIVQSTSVSSSSSSSTTTSNSNSPSSSSSVNSNYYNPVDMIPPPPVPSSSSGSGGPDNVITYFTEEPTSPRTSTRAPSRGNDRNRHRLPLTNSHSLMPSTTTTQINTSGTLNDEEVDKSNSSTRDAITSSSSQDQDGGPTNTGTLASSSGDVRYRSTLHKTSKTTSGHSGGVRESIVHVTPSDAKANRSGSPQSKDGHKYNQDAFAKRHGLVDDHDGEDVENSNPQRDTLMLQHNSDDNQNNHRHKNNHHQPNTSDEFGKGEEVSTSTVKFHSPTPSSSHQGVLPKNKSEYFMPITPIISSERPEESNEDLLNNHKMPISFDRISPDFYDKNPWTPLLDRPNMDKRPRVDISRPSSTSQGYTTSSPEPIIVWNTEYSHNDNNNEDLRANSSPAPPPAAASPQNYYGYGHTAPGSSSPSNASNKEIRNQNAKPTLEFDDNEPISHGINTYSSSKPTATSPTRTKSSQEQMTVQVGVNNTTKKGGGTTTVVEPSSPYVEETTGGFRPLAIPSYTVIIPHIPNSPPKNGHEQGKGAKGKGSQNPKNADAETDRNLNTSVQFDRVGLVELDEENSGEKVQRVSDKRRQSGDDAVNYRPNEHKTDNDHGNVENDMTKNEPEDIKEEDYGDNDELSGSNPSPTKIYKLDPDNVDIVPDTLGDTNTHVMESQNLKKPNSTVTESDRLINHDSSSEKNNFYYHSTEQETTPKMPDPIIKSTTDLIMSTLGSLNLIKSSPTAQAQRDDVESKLRASDFAESSESMEDDDDSDVDHDGGGDNDEPGVDSPLFPPVRSYVGVNLPLRPKPSPASLTEEDSGPNKKLRMSNDQGSVRPDFNAVSNLQKVLSMMMKFEGEDESRDLKADITPSVNVTKQNVNLVLAKINESTVTATALPSATSTSTHREQKSYKNRHSKIDEQFAPPSNVEHIPVPLIVTEPPKIPVVGNLPSNKMTLTNVTINDQNSPVYKFVLRQGQAIEDLLKEIFLNYTDIQGEEGDSPSTTELLTQISASRPSTSLKNSSSLKSISNFHNLNDKSKTEQTTQNGVTFASVKINHPHLRPLSQSMVTTTSSSIRTSDAPVQTSTSIVINQDDETLEECPKNISFTCVSTGRCIPSYLRCNFIKECPDNSDESNCSCADFLRANGNGRKLCDGVVDCADGSDEYQVCEYCKPGQYICSGSRSCINKTQICDSKRDCPNGDDENDCVKIGQSHIPPEGTDLEEFSSTYNKNGHLMVRKKGVWGKLCVDTFSSVVSHWEVKDLARAVCKALTFSDFDSVERIQDKSVNSSTPYYELFYGVSNNDTDDSSPSSDDEPYSSESTPRVGLGFKTTECKSKLVVNVTCQDLQCGTAPKSFTQTSRIVGGSNSNPGNWPWQAALYKSGSYQCGATLISSRWLLSAGHCFYNAQDDYWVARLGTLRRGAAVLSPYEQVVKITHIFLHPGYQNVGFVNDISLLRLEKEVNFTDYVRPICLPSRENKIRDGRMCTVVGWGQLQEVGRIFPDTLQEVQLPLISTSECRKRTLFLPLYKLTDAMFCAGFDRGGRDACLGDSGGSIGCPENDGRWSIYGVTSNGYGCARAARPGVYTKVASYLDWIHEKMSLENSFALKEKPKHCSGHRCLLGECLDKRQVCNGIVDCIEDNGSDERGPNCTTHLGLAAT